MNKVFLYLYPIEEYFKILTFSEEYYKKNGWRLPSEVLNETIQKRYRDKGYQVVIAIYPDKDIFGISVKDEDKIIFTDVSFKDATGYNEDGSMKAESEVKYPNEQFLLNQLGNVDELIIGGFHAADCVKRVGDVAISNNINTLIDLDMTDFFFNLYRDEEYFDIDSYDLEKYKEYRVSRAARYGGYELAEKEFFERYNSPAYGFSRISGRLK